MSKTRSHSLHMSTDLGAKIFGVASIDDTIIMVGGYQNDGPPNQVCSFKKYF